MNLGESFSDEQKIDYVRRNLKPGSVIKIFCKTTHPPKEKRLVIITLNPELLFFVINSEIPKFYQNKPHLKNQQINLKKVAENFLDHDSWLDCSKVFQEFNISEIREVLFNNISRILGKLSDKAISDLMDVVNESETLDRRHINAVLSNM